MHKGIEKLKNLVDKKSHPRPNLEELKEAADAESDKVLKEQEKKRKRKRSQEKAQEKALQKTFDKTQANQKTKKKKGKTA